MYLSILISGVRIYAHARKFGFVVVHRVADVKVTVHPALDFEFRVQDSVHVAQLFAFFRQLTQQFRIVFSVVIDEFVERNWKAKFRRCVRYDDVDLTNVFHDPIDPFLIEVEAFVCEIPVFWQTQTVDRNGSA